MATTKIGQQKPTKAYRTTEEYTTAARHCRRCTVRLLVSLLAIAVPALYFAAAVQLEHFLLPLWSLPIGFYIFILGIALAAVIIPLLFRLLQCPFTYWKLFLGIVVSLGFGYLTSIAVFYWTELEPNDLLTGEIIAGVQALVTTVYAVIGVNRNLWDRTHERSKKKNVRDVYQRFELAVNDDPADIMTIYTLAESDYSFAKEYMKKKSAAAALYETAKTSFAAAAITESEYRELLVAASKYGSREATLEMARVYIRCSEADLIKLSAGEKTHALSILSELEAETENDAARAPLLAVLQARLRSSMILSTNNTDQNIAALVDSSSALKDYIAGGRLSKELSDEAGRVLRYAEEAVQRLLVYQNSKR